MNTLDVQGWGDLRVSGQIRAAGPVRIVARANFNDGDLVLEDYSPTLPTKIESDQTIVLAAERAFRNHTSYESPLFPGDGRVLIFSGTDTHGYNQGNLGFREEYNVAYDPASLPNRAENTIFINQEQPAADTLIIAAKDILKIFDNKRVEIDPEEFTDLSGLQFRIDGGDGSEGINAGTYTIVPYGLALNSTRVLFEPATLTIERRNILRCPECPLDIKFLDKRYGDETPDLTGIAMNVLSLAEGHTLADVGLTLTTPGKTAPVGRHHVHIVFDPQHEQAKNYILPDNPHWLADVRIDPRKVLIDFGFIHIVKDYETLPERPNFLLLGAPDFVSEEDFRPYINISMPPWATGYGAYPLQFSLNGGEAFLSNYDLTLQGEVVLIEPDLRYMIEEGWKKAFPPPVWECETLGSIVVTVDAGGEAPGNVQPPLMCGWVGNPRFAPGQEPGGPPALVNFSSQSWPVVARALGAWITARDSKFSEDAFLELLLAIDNGDMDTLGAVMPFLMDEFVSLLQKDESELKPEEMAFLLEFLDSLNQQRSHAASVAIRQYEDWKEEHRRKTTGGNPLLEMFYIEPAPPDTFLEMALTGFVVDDHHDELWERTVAAMSSALGAGAAAGGAAAGVASTGALKVVSDIIVPFAARAAGSAAAGVGAIAGGVGIGVAAIITLGFVIDQVVKAVNYKDQLEEASRIANTPLTLDSLRQILNEDPDYLLAHFTIHVTRPHGLFIPL